MKKIRSATQIVSFLLILSILFLYVPLFLVGCGGGAGGGNVEWFGGYNGGGSTPSTPAITTTQVTGNVNTSEIGGTNLSVISVWQDASSVSSNGSVTSTVSQKGTQLLFVIDVSSQLRGMALSVPQESRKGDVAFDANSTAISLLFLTPGILTTDPKETPQRISELQSLSGFSTLLSYLKTNLPVKAISDIVKDTQYGQLLGNCINEWMKLHPFENRTLSMIKKGMVPKFPQKRSISSNGYCYLDPNDSSNLSSVRYTIGNYGWRTVVVDRRVLDKNSNQLSVNRIANGRDDLDGIVPLSIGSIFNIFNPSWGNPTTMTDYVDFSPPAHKLQYWITGPGYLPGDTLPPTMILDDADAWANTVLQFIVLPLLGLATGIPASELYDANKDIFKGIRDYMDVSKLQSAQDKEQSKTELSRTFVNLATTDAAIQYIKNVLVAKGFSLVGGSLSVIFAAFSVASTVYNCEMAADFLSKSPRVAKIEVRTPASSVSTHLTGIKLSPSSVTIPSKQSQTFFAVGQYDDDSTSDVSGQVTWSCDNTSVGTISKAGLFTAASNINSTQTAHITVEKDGITSNQATVTVNNDEDVGHWNVQLEEVYSGYGAIKCIYFLDTQNGWAVAENGGFNVIYRTTNGGDTWEYYSDNSAGPMYIIDIYFSDTQNGLAFTEYDIWQTTNGGHSWKKIFGVIGDTHRFRGVHFTNSQNGWVVGEKREVINNTNTIRGVIYHTNDWGVTWKEQSLGIAGCDRLFSVYFSDNQNGWVSGTGEANGGVIYHTNDGGLSWTKQIQMNAGCLCEKIFFTDLQNGWATVLDGSSYNASIYHTNDGGITWKSQYSESNCHFNSLYFTDSKNGWVVGSRRVQKADYVLHTIDGGMTWKKHKFGWEWGNYFGIPSLCSVYFIDPHNGWFGGEGLSYQDQPLILKYSDTSNFINKPIISDCNGRIEQGTTLPVTIRGAYFGDSQGDGYVNFGSVVQRSIISWSNKKIECNFPNGVPSGNAYTYVCTDTNETSNKVRISVVSPSPGGGGGGGGTPPPTPTITNITPDPAAQNEYIWITGTNFGSSQGSGYVNFGDTQQATVKEWNDTQIVCKVPVTAPVGSVVVSVHSYYGTIASAILNVTAAETWHIETIDGIGGFCYGCSSIASSTGGGGNQCISFLVAPGDPASNSLKYAKNNGGAYWSMETVDTDIGTAPFGATSSLSMYEISSGWPGISYRKGDDIHAMLWNGIVDAWGINVIDTAGPSEGHTSLLNAFGELCLSYMSNGLKFSTRNPVTNTWTTPETVDDSFILGGFNSLSLPGPAMYRVSYIDNDHNSLKYAEKNGYDGWSKETIAINVGASHSIASYLPSSKLALSPIICYCDLTSSKLKCATKQGGTWIFDTIDDTPPFGGNVVIAMDGSSNPCIAYNDMTSLKYARWNGVAWNIETVDSMNPLVSRISFVFDPSTWRPCISYMTDGILKFATKY